MFVVVVTAGMLVFDIDDLGKFMMQFLYLEFWWAIHNLVGHPLSQLTWWASLFGKIKCLASFSEWLHDWTVPIHESNGGRG